MKTIVVYYSLEGNTAYAAKKIAGNLNAELLSIRPEQSYPDKGFRKFFWAGKSAVMAETPKMMPYQIDIRDFDQIIIGFPVWAGTFAPPVRSFIKDHEALLKEKRISVFACQSGSGAEKAFQKLLAALGRDSFDAELVLIDPKTKENAENDRKIRDFCSKLR